LLTKDFSREEIKMADDLKALADGMPSLLWDIET